MFKMDSKVAINLSGIVSTNSDKTGRVVGYAHKREVPMILMELDQGFYNKDETIYVSVLLVHPESIRPID